MCVPFSPEILQAGAVKGLMSTNSALCRRYDEISVAGSTEALFCLVCTVLKNTSSIRAARNALTSRRPHCFATRYCPCSTEGVFNRLC